MYHMWCNITVAGNFTTEQTSLESTFVYWWPLVWGSRLGYVQGTLSERE